MGNYQATSRDQIPRIWALGVGEREQARHSPRGGAGDDGGTPVRLIFFFKRGEEMEMGERVL